VIVSGTSAPTVQGEEPIPYVGSKKCKTCHAEEHKTWSKMKHSKAWDSLTAEQIKSGKDEQGRTCVSCHVTGYGKPGGFTSEADTPELKNVGCESCHGAGKKHQKRMTMAMMNDEDAEKIEDKFISKGLPNCTECHNPHISYKEKYGQK
jgi:nitrate/TMAO reductase-like tetraheme cytochrome c subunit